MGGSDTHYPKAEAMMIDNHTNPCDEKQFENEMKAIDNEADDMVNDPEGYNSDEEKDDKEKKKAKNRVRKERKEEKVENRVRHVRITGRGRPVLVLLLEPEMRNMLQISTLYWKRSATFPLLISPTLVSIIPTKKFFYAWNVL